MPRYDYECQTCHHVFEVKQAFSSEPVANCPKCNNGARRLIHSVPVVFKGSGWYVNDYGKGGGASGSSSESKASASEGDSKSDSKAKSDSPKKDEPKKESAAKK